jgi:cytochrome oxidase assembly protein ShyY1
VLRGLLSPKWLGLFALVLVIAAACTLLGLWQLGVARDEGRKEAVAAAAQLQRAPLQQVTRAHAAFEAEFSNRPVTVTGTYDDSRTILVVDRRLGERAGSWVVTPLVTDGGTVAVLRGFVDGLPATPPPAPTGVVTVEGSLGPSESPRAGAPLPAPQARSIDLAALVNEWPGDLYNVVVLASSEAPAGPGMPGGAVAGVAGSSAGTAGAGVTAAADVTRVPPPDVDTPLNLRNAAYAVQWWVFGLFAFWMWWKMFRAEQQADAVPAAEREEIPA